MTFYNAIELGLLGVLVALLFDFPPQLGRIIAAILLAVLVVLAFLGRHA